MTFPEAPIYSGKVSNEKLIRSGRFIRSVAGLVLSASVFAGVTADASGGSVKAVYRPHHAKVHRAPIEYAAPGPKVLLPGSHHREQEQFGSQTYVDYENASGFGPILRKGAKVIVDCYVSGPADATKVPNGLWYHISQPKGYAGYFVPSDSFTNGDTVGRPSTQPALDASVPECPSAEPAPVTTTTTTAPTTTTVVKPAPTTTIVTTTTQPQPAKYFETLYNGDGIPESGVNVFTDYHNASGIVGHISYPATVQVACRLQDPESAVDVPSTNGGWWYRLSAGYNGQTGYVPTDVWDNTTNPALMATEVYDPNVPLC